MLRAPAHRAMRTARLASPRRTLAAMRTQHDVVIAGAGPAGLSAALVLGRARLRTVVVDGGPARNASAPATHGWLGHDGASPDELRRRGRADLAKYEHVELVDGRVASLARETNGVRVELASGDVLRARRVILATGIVDVLPKIAGLRDVWGRDAFSCAHCHGFEHADATWAVLAVERGVARTVLPLRAWARELVLLLNGRTDVPESELAPLRAAGVRVEPRAVARVVAEDGALRGVELEGGEHVACGALFLHPAARSADVVLYAGLALDERGLVRSDAVGETSMARVHVVGDAAGRRASALTAATDGAQVAMSLVELLTAERFGAP